MIHWITHGTPRAGYLGKRENANVPGVGHLMGPCQHLYVGRDTKDAKEIRDLLIEAIKDRQIRCENKEATPLCIFPEGATTNGLSILEFKKGAFCSLRGVKPFFTKYQSLRSGVRPVHGDANSLVAHIIVCFHCIFSVFTVYEMPVFTPNDYFWKNHWDGKEEKWVVFARTVRQLMIEQGNFEPTTCTM